VTGEAGSQAVAHWRAFNEPSFHPDPYSHDNNVGTKSCQQSNGDDLKSNRNVSISTVQIRSLLLWPLTAVLKIYCSRDLVPSWMRSRGVGNRSFFRLWFTGDGFMDEILPWWTARGVWRGGTEAGGGKGGQQSLSLSRRPDLSNSQWLTATWNSTTFHFPIITRAGVLNFFLFSHFFSLKKEKKLEEGKLPP
jgi:hypothetical protein